jgi:hypothetical protein
MELSLEDRIVKRVLRYGVRHIKDRDNIIALEICYLIHQAFEKKRRKLCRKKQKSSKSGFCTCSL